ncbi:MAG TPA: PAS domain-containing protein [Thermoanaerobaculia bacterium]|nr:PAS domain-containing protein [Thermoanaerobaculia bacterium]
MTRADRRFDSSIPGEPIAREALLRAPIGICQLTRSGEIAFANPALAGILGFSSPAELQTTLDSASLFHEESLRDSIETLAAGRLSFEGGEALFRTREGSPLLVHLDGTALEDGSGWIVFVREAGREKEREVELARTLAELENTMQTIPDILYTLDVEARLIRWNRKLETATGFDPEDLRLRPGFELFPDEEKRTFAKAIMDAFATGYAEFETRLLSKGGDTIPYQWTAVPLEDARGEVVGLAGAGRDITEWKKNEEARARLEDVIHNRAREWQLTFDAIESPIVIADDSGRISRLNRSARDLLGEDLEFREVVGSHLGEWAGVEPWHSILRLVESPREIAAAEAHDAESGRSWHIARSTLPATHGADGEERAPRTILIVRDITKMLELQEIARKSQIMSAVGQLIVGVAHEVRNPIFGISATLDAFEASFPVDQDSRQFIEVLRGEIGRMSELMQELLDYGRPAKLELQQVLLSEVVAQAARACGRSGEHARVGIDDRVSPDLPPVRVDRRKLVQVFQNLIENAIQFSPAGSSVVLTAAAIDSGSGRWLSSTVLDSGPGFGPGDLSRIFEPFYTRRRGGTGLGLSIVQRIVDEHGGRLEPANRPEGGASMTVLLPLEPG